MSTIAYETFSKPRTQASIKGVSLSTSKQSIY